MAAAAAAHRSVMVGLAYPGARGDAAVSHYNKSTRRKTDKSHHCEVIETLSFLILITNRAAIQ